MMKVNSKAAVKRIPVGTKLRLVGPSTWGHRPEDLIKVVHLVQSNAIAFMNSDGRLSWLGLDDPDIRIEGTGRGFRVVEKEPGKITGATYVRLEYEFLEDGEVQA